MTIRLLLGDYSLKETHLTGLIEEHYGRILEGTPNDEMEVMVEFEVPENARAFKAVLDGAFRKRTT